MNLIAPLTVCHHPHSCPTVPTSSSHEGGNGRDTMTSALLEALSDVDEGTISFLLDTLSSFQAEDCDWEEEVAPLVESFVEESSAVLAILQSDPTAVAKAKEVLLGRQEDAAAGASDSTDAPQQTPNLLQSKRYTEIPGAQNRAISLRQLKDIYEYVEAQAESDGSLPWIDRNELSPTNGQRMHVKTINLYQLVDSVVMPLTKSHQCRLEINDMMQIAVFHAFCADTLSVIFVDFL